MPLIQTGNLVNNLTGAGPDGQSAEYFGTVTINGATAVPVTQTAYLAGDVVLFGLLTGAGTVGNIPYVFATTNGTAGVTGFQVKGTASDTSVYQYWGFTPKAAQTA